MGPDTTVGTAAIGGAVGVIVVWILGLCGILVPDTVAGAIATLSAVVFGWVMPYPGMKESKE
jgi:hypothetical protein